MLNEIIQSPTTGFLSCALVAVAALVAALVISSGIRLNKGAGVNGPLLLAAVGFIFTAVAACFVVFGYLEGDGLGAVAHPILAFAMLVQLVAWIWWRAVMKSLAR